MKQASIFQQLGLSGNATRAYKALLSLGPANISDVARRARLHRPATYHAIDELRRRELVSVVVRGKRQWYAAEPPSVLTTHLEEQLENMKTEVTNLESLYNKKPQKPKVTYMEGRGVIERSFLDIPNTLNKGDTFYRYSSRDTRKDSIHMSQRALEAYRKARDEKQLERFVITNKGNLSRKKPKLERATKLVPQDFDLFDHDVSQIIYGNKILLVDYNSDTAILTENATMARFQMRLFQLLFKLLPGKPM